MLAYSLYILFKSGVYIHCFKIIRKSENYSRFILNIRICVLYLHRLNILRRYKGSENFESWI